MNTLVKDFMVQPVASMALPNDVGTVRDLMNRKNCHAIPLVEVGEGKEITIRGIVTSDDLLGVYDDSVDIQQVMNREIHAVGPDTDARTAARMMLKYQLHHLLVMEAGRIVGIISSIDFVKLVAEGEQ
jgi:CBS domain-containing protein